MCLKACGSSITFSKIISRKVDSGSAKHQDICVHIIIDTIHLLEVSNTTKYLVEISLGREVTQVLDRTGK